MINQSYDPMISKYLHFIVDNIFYNDYSYNIDHYRYLFYENGNVFGKVWEFIQMCNVLTV